MTGVLGRLAARARGATEGLASAGIRPHLPSRFEAGIGSADRGFVELSLETVAPRPEPSAGATKLSPTPDAPPARSAEPRPRQSAAPAAGSPLPPRRDPPAPLQPPAQAGPTQELLPRQVNSAPAADRAPSDVERPMPHGRTPRPAAPLPAPAPAAATTPLHIPRAAAPSAAEPPEIVIHIGRIDIRGDAPGPPRPAPERSRRATTGLADYLRRRGDRG